MKGATSACRSGHPPVRHFNPRSREGSDCQIARLKSRYNHFNPRSREGSDGAPTGTAPGGNRAISIHAPAKGATIITMTSRKGGKISIHAPAKGATSMYGDAVSIAQISIHAPAKGATESSHHPLHGICIFQSTLPRRERRSSPRSCSCALHFNPRSREGSDEKKPQELYCLHAFQSTLP